MELLTNIVSLALIIGWIANIVKLAGSDFDPLTGMVVLRIVGIILLPIGSVLGFL